MNGETLRACIFVHWNRKNQFTKYDFDLIYALSDQVDQLIVVRNVNNSFPIKTPPKFPKNTIFLDRENSGYDFGGYKYGIEYLLNSRSSITEITICNNSILLIAEDLNNIFTSLRKSEFDLTGATESFERGWHVQSYFLHFKDSLVKNICFENWWRNLLVSDKKSETVEHLEIPMANYFVKSGFDVGVLWPYAKIRDFALSIQGISILNRAKFLRSSKIIYTKLNSDIPLNPTHFLWKHLVYLGFPFIKKDLAEGRVAKALSADDWQTLKQPSQELLES